jgi:hypothetical protein
MNGDLRISVLDGLGYVMFFLSISNRAVLLVSSNVGSRSVAVVAGMKGDPKRPTQSKDVLPWKPKLPLHFDELLLMETITIAKPFSSSTFIDDGSIGADTSYNACPCLSCTAPLPPLLPPAHMDCSMGATIRGEMPLTNKLRECLSPNNAVSIPSGMSYARRNSVGVRWRHTQPNPLNTNQQAICRSGREMSHNPAGCSKSLRRLIRARGMGRLTGKTGLIS